MYPVQFVKSAVWAKDGDSRGKGLSGPPFGDAAPLSLRHGTRLWRKD